MINIINVLILKDDNNEEIKKYVDNVEEVSFNEYKSVKLYSKKIEKIKVDIYLIISNNYEFIEEKFNEIKIKDNILIVTNKFEPKHILACLLLTENLFSLKKGERYILEKIQYVYGKLRESKMSKRRSISV